MKFVEFGVFFLSYIFILIGEYFLSFYYGNMYDFWNM